MDTLGSGAHVCFSLVGVHVHRGLIGKCAVVPHPVVIFFNTGINLLPSSQIEIADAKIGAFGNEQGLLQCGEQFGINVVENSRHK